MDKKIDQGADRRMSGSKNKSKYGLLSRSKSGFNESIIGSRSGLKIG